MKKSCFLVSRLGRAQLIQTANETLTNCQVNTLNLDVNNVQYPPPQIEITIYKEIFKVKQTL